MNCNEFETLMADALGNELAPQDRPSFEAHLAECAECRGRYESFTKVVRSMRELPGPKRVVLRRDAGRLILEEAAAPAQPRRPVRLAGIVRYAASLLIAFTAGYAVHAGITLTTGSAPTGRTITSQQPDHGAPTLQSSLARAFAHDAGKSDLAQCLIAMAQRR